MAKIIFKRVSYGKKSTPKKDREYRIAEVDGRHMSGFNSPVGTKKEINAWARLHKIPRKDIRIVE